MTQHYDKMAGLALIGSMLYPADPPQPPDIFYDRTPEIDLPRGKKHSPAEQKHAAKRRKKNRQQKKARRRNRK